MKKHFLQGICFVVFVRLCAEYIGVLSDENRGNQTEN